MVRPLLLILALLALPGTAGAATVEMRVTSIDPGSKYDVAEAYVELLVVDTRDERNEIAVRPLRDRVEVTDAASPLQAGQGCEQRGERMVACGSPVMPRLSGVLRLGGGDDVAHDGFGLHLEGGAGDDVLDGASVDGGPGADVLSGHVTYAARTAPVRVSLDGVANDGEAGEGDDVRVTSLVTGGAGDDALTGPAVDRHVRLVGGPGDDALTGGAGGDDLVGGPGADVLDGGDGRDRAMYDDRREPVRVTLAGGADDGEAGEGDDVRRVEGVAGGHGADVLVGAATGDGLVGGPGRDVLRGGAGDDVLVGSDSLSRFDVDVLAGGAGRDNIQAGLDERIDVRGGGRDRVDCAAGFVGTLRGDAADDANSCAPPVFVSGGPDRPVRARGGRAHFGVRCPAESPIACVGVLRLRYDRSLGAKGFRIAPGTREIVAVPLNRRGRLLLRRRPRGTRVAVLVNTLRTRPASTWGGFGANARLLPPR